MLQPLKASSNLSAKGVQTPFKGTVKSGLRWLETLFEGRDLEEFKSKRGSFVGDLEKAGREMNEQFSVWRQRSTTLEGACHYAMGMYEGMRNAPEVKLLEIEYRKFKRVSLIQRQER